MIPETLKKEGFKFILVRNKGKEAIETGWNEENNYSFDNEKLQTHMNKGGNYGFVCGNGIIVVDADSKKVYELVKDLLPETFTVKTAKQFGHHYYYKCEGFNETKRLKDGETKIGDIQANGTYVVGANSTHPSGKRYTIINDTEIMTVSKNIIDKVFSKFYASTERIGKEVILSGVSEGSRNETMFRMACSFRARGLKPEETYQMLQAVNEKNKPKLSDGELKNIVKSAYNYSNKKDVASEDLNYLVISLLASNQRRDATEELCKEIKRLNHIYTTRDDEKSEMWIYNTGIYIPQGKTFIREFCRRVLGKAFTTTLANEVISKIETDTYIDQDEFFKNDNISEVAVENGILNIFKGELKSFSPDTIFFNKLPVKFDESKDCPSVKAHLKAVLKNEEDIPVFQELFGFLLLKEYKFEKMFMFLGDGRNGKSKTVELMKRFIGVENCANIPPKQFETDGFSVGELFNKMANLGADIGSDTLKDTSSLKALTGRDMISAQRKFLNRVSFTNYAKLIFCCNKLPRTFDSSMAFWNRWVLIEYPFTFLSQEELDVAVDKKWLKLKDGDIVSKLTTPEELSGLLNWALKGLYRLLEKGDFSYSKNTDEVKTMWIRRSNSFEAFLMDECVEDWDSKIRKDDLRKAYGLYCRKFKVKNVGDKVIKGTLENMGVGTSRASDPDRSMVWDGLKFVKGDKDVNGISSLGTFSNFAIGENKVDKCDSLDKKPQISEEFIKEGSKKSQDVVQSIIGKELSLFIDNKISKQEFADKFGDKRIEELIKHGEIYENPAGILRLV